MVNEKRLIDAMRLVAKLSKKVRFGRIENDDMLAVIADAPTVDAVEAVHGRWLTTHTVDTWMGISKIDGFICSECGVSSKRGGNYCPNCGARMDRGEDI